MHPVACTQDDARHDHIGIHGHFEMLLEGPVSMKQPWKIPMSESSPIYPPEGLFQTSLPSGM